MSDIKTVRYNFPEVIEFTSYKDHKDIFIKMLKHIYENGIVLTSERNQKYKESPNPVIMTIIEPKLGPTKDIINQEILEYFPTNFMEKYAINVASGIEEEGFSYSYGERINRYGQLDECIEKLKEFPETRQATLTIRVPTDIYLESPPCMTVVDFKIRNNKLSSFIWLRSNDALCVTGDTLVAVADGRNTVPIKQLAKEGKDIPVYCCDKNGKVHIRMGRHPRLTRKNVDTWKVKFNHGGCIKATEDHKFIKRDGSIVTLKNLKYHESLMPITKYIKNKYWYVGFGNDIEREHRKIYEFYNGKTNDIIHHVDGNRLNNNIFNLISMDKESHHSIHNKGENNPMYGKKHSETIKKKISEELKEYYEKNGTDYLKGEKKERLEYKCKYCGKVIYLTEKAYLKREQSSMHSNIFCSQSCQGKFYASNEVKYTDEEIIKAGVKFYKIYKKLPTMKEWIKFSKNEEIPSLTTIHTRFGGINNFRELIIDFNHTIVSKKYYGKEDVYNITVDDHHTIGYITEVDNKSLKGIFTKNCGWPGNYMELLYTTVRVASEVGLDINCIRTMSQSMHYYTRSEQLVKLIINEL